MKRFNLKNMSQQALDIYHLEDFSPKIIDATYLENLGVSVEPNAKTLEKLRNGSINFIEKLKNKKVIPEPVVYFDTIDLEQPLEIHNYTGACPTMTYELNPVIGCSVGCLYCLVTDGEHVQKMVVYENYPEYVNKHLEEKYQTSHYYYFSPKTECFQDATLQTGIAHKILEVFINHFITHPKSKARLFIATKGGIHQLNYAFNGVKIIDLLKKLKGKVQFNTSVSIMPDALRNILEPFAPTIEERLKAVELCQSEGILADSALVQPIVAPYLNDQIIHDFFKMLKSYHIINYKPEFLTLCMENLAMIGQIQGYFDRTIEKELYEFYIEPDNENHKKQRGRMAPSRHLSKKYLDQIMSISQNYGLSVSICYWVRQQLSIEESLIPLINKHGYQCLGYQSKLLKEDDEDGCI